jgi:very-short-patch-repair endonuclease
MPSAREDAVYRTLTVVEVDGPYHEGRRDADMRRDRALARGGYTVLRLDADLVMRDVTGATARIREAIAQLQSRTGR